MTASANPPADLGSNLPFLKAMSGQNATLDLIHFACPHCRAELSVPANLAGVEGPCPSCFESIRAPYPIQEALYSDAPLLPAMPQAPPVSFPPPREGEGQPIPHLPRLAPADPEFSLTPPERNFKARLAIPPGDEPLDDSWKDRHRAQGRQTRRARRAEDTAHNVIHSRAFAVARVCLIMLSGAMLVWLFQYLQSHQWRLPGMAPVVVDEKKAGSTTTTVKPAGSNANELMADDDAEIPAAANHPPGHSTPSSPIAGRKVP